MPKLVDHDQRRAEIAEAAARVIASGGMETATIRKIAAASGHSKGIVEHYFDGKSELIAAALAWANERYLERAAHATFGLTGLSALRARIAATVPTTAELVSEWRVRLVFWSLAAIEPELRRKQAARTRDAVDHYAGDLADAVEVGEIGPSIDVRSTARRVLFAVTGLSCSLLHDPRTFPRTRVRDEIDFIVSIATSAA